MRKAAGVVDPLLTPRTRSLCFKKASETVSSAVDMSKRMENDDGGIVYLVYPPPALYFIFVVGEEDVHFGHSYFCPDH